MNLFKMVLHRLSITVLAMGILFSAAACGAEPTLTPTPTPELTVNDLLSSAGEELAAMSSAKFQMVDELEKRAKFFGTTFKSLEGEVKSPDSFRMLVNVVARGLGFVEIEMMAVGEQAYMKFSKDAPWLPLPLDQVPFNFGGIGVTLSAILPTMKNSAIAERESLAGVQAIRVDGDVLSEEMSNLITSVDSDHPTTLTFWFDEVEHTLQQFKIADQLFDDDAPETIRLVTMDVNVPVDVQLPDIDSDS